jgi:hypothetical protein
MIEIYLQKVISEKLRKKINIVGVLKPFEGH